MTAEIAILNKFGVALAADSAVTISFPENSGAKRNSKIYSTNKLFMLSKYYPVGVMIYGNAGLMGVPWELIIKEYRKRQLGDKHYSQLVEYARDFIGYLNGNTFYFPEELQKDRVYY